MGWLQHQCEDIPKIFHDIPVMAMTATATPDILKRLSHFLNNPVLIKEPINQSNIYLSVHEYNFKKSDGPSKSFSLDRRDFNDFVDNVSWLIMDSCAIVYTIFANHVGPIVLALRDCGLLWKDERL